jgi:hypothetical protein
MARMCQNFYVALTFPNLLIFLFGNSSDIDNLIGIFNVYIYKIRHIILRTGLPLASFGFKSLASITSTFNIIFGAWNNFKTSFIWEGGYTYVIPIWRKSLNLYKQLSVNILFHFIVICVKNYCFNVQLGAFIAMFMKCKVWVVTLKTSYIDL